VSPSADRCIHCERSAEDARLEKCPICFKRFCHDHRHEMSGRKFCSTQCAHHFFFGDPDDEDMDVD
jgi:uncharacterized UBP type Zn finger protein